MKPIFSLPILFVLIKLSSCTKVIDLNLNDAEKKYVIEATITNQPGGCKVLISRSKNFDDDNQFQGISGAIVTIADNTGNSTFLTEMSSGIYEAPALVATAGTTYNMQVRIDTTAFTATAKMPKQVSFDTLFVSDEILFGGHWKLANIEFNDPPGKGDGYLLIQKMNGVKTKQIYVFNDDLTDGNHQTIKLYLRPGTEDEDKIKTGDTLQVDMMCIEPAIYKYWYSADQSATGSNQSASPSNPVTNISGGALGYFSAQTTDTKTIIVP